jgi:two-component system, NarL family, sensor kinase
MSIAIQVATAALHLVQTDDQIRLEIKDAGKGIPLEKQVALSSRGQLGVGFRGMRERMSQLGGVLEIQSNGNGTVVTAILPLKKSAIVPASEGIA